MIEIRIPTDDDFDAIAVADSRAFGSPWTPERKQGVRTVMDLERFRIAVDGAMVVGIAGSYGFETTMPGGHLLPTGGVTWVSVATTHRRQGLLGRLMDAVHDDIDARGEPLAALTASEGGIYERFGYGMASRRRRIAIERRRAVLAERWRPQPGSVRFVDADEIEAALAPRWDRFRRGKVGEISRSAAWTRQMTLHERDSIAVVAHDDGYVVWKSEPRSSEGIPGNVMTLLQFVAATPEAHLALWHTVLSVDLVGSIESWVVPLDDPLPYFLTEPRSLRTTTLIDNVWCNIRDVAACFGARTYGTDDDVVVEVDGRRWRVGAGGCSRVRSKPDLVADRASLGSLVLGGVRPSELHAARRLTASSPAALRRADALFTTSPLPSCQTGF